MTSTPPKMPVKLTEQSLISLRLLAVVLAILVPVAGAWWHMTSLVQDIGWELRLLREKVNQVAERQGVNHETFVTRDQLQAWIRECRALGLDVPSSPW